MYTGVKEMKSKIPCCPRHGPLMTLSEWGKFVADIKKLMPPNQDVMRGVKCDLRCRQCCTWRTSRSITKETTVEGMKDANT
jgi:hypothetical protein